MMHGQHAPERSDVLNWMLYRVVRKCSAGVLHKNVGYVDGRGGAGACLDLEDAPGMTGPGRGPVATVPDGLLGSGGTGCSKSGHNPGQDRCPTHGYRPLSTQLRIAGDA